MGDEIFIFLITIVLMACIGLAIVSGLHVVALLWLFVALGFVLFALVKSLADLKHVK
jgi:4-hydroxybenzoate polyprenyltransferase